MRTLLITFSLMLVAWGFLIELLLVAGGTTMQQAISEREESLDTKKGFESKIAQIAYLAFDFRRTLGCIGIVLFFSALLFF